MGALIFYTFLMLCFTFAVGFVVAAVIRAVAYVADSMEFHSLHQVELARLKKIQKFTRREFWHTMYAPSTDRAAPDYGLNSFYKGVDLEKIDPESSEKFYHETSEGSSVFSLMDYYYPSDEQIAIAAYNSRLEKELTPEQPRKTTSKK